MRWKKSWEFGTSFTFSSIRSVELSLSLTDDVPFNTLFVTFAMKFC